jgi:hypothetical protein
MTRQKKTTGTHNCHPFVSVSTTYLQQCVIDTLYNVNFFGKTGQNGPLKVVRKYLQPHTIAVLGQQQQSTANVVVHVQSNQQRQRYV